MRAAGSAASRSRSPAAEEALAAAMSPAADAVRAQVDHLNHCIDLLRDQQRELCDLRYRAELPNGRIAELTGLNPTTVAKSLQRIREQLRECIESRAREAGDGSLASPSGVGHDRSAPC